MSVGEESEPWVDGFISMMTDLMWSGPEPRMRDRVRDRKWRSRC